MIEDQFKTSPDLEKAKKKEQETEEKKRLRNLMLKPLIKYYRLLKKLRLN